MSELKACPFCGVVPDGFCEIDSMLGHVACLNNDCEANNYYLDIETWQSRPIEDGLRAELEKRTAELHYANTACMEMKHELDRLNAEIKTTEIEKLQIRLSEWRGVAMLLVDELNEAKSKQLPTSWEDASVASPAYIAYRNLVDVEDDETNPDYYKGVQNDK